MTCTAAVVLWWRTATVHVILRVSHGIVVHLLLLWHGLWHTGLELIWVAALETAHGLPHWLPHRLPHWLHLWLLVTCVESVAHWWLHASLKLVVSTLATLHTHHASTKLIHLRLLLLLMFLCLLLFLCLENCLQLKHRVIIGSAEPVLIDLFLLGLALRWTAEIEATEIVCRLLLLLLLRHGLLLLWCWLCRGSTTAKHVKEVSTASCGTWKI